MHILPDVEVADTAFENNIFVIGRYQILIPHIYRDYRPAQH